MVLNIKLFQKQSILVPIFPKSEWNICKNSALKSQNVYLWFEHHLSIRNTKCLSLSSKLKEIFAFVQTYKFFKKRVKFFFGSRSSKIFF